MKPRKSVLITAWLSLLLTLVAMVMTIQRFMVGYEEAPQLLIVTFLLIGITSLLFFSRNH